MRKYYTYNLVGDGGVVLGGGIAKAWFWVSVFTVHKEACKSVPDNTWIADFRRIK